MATHQFWAKVYAGFFEKMTIDEFKMVHLPPESNVLVIGCGSFPHTMFTLARVRRWKLNGIDIDADALANAQQLVQTHGLSDRITIQHGEGSTVDITGYAMVLVAHGVEPKYDVLESLARRLQPGMMIFYRTIWDKLEKVYGEEPLPASLIVRDVHYRSDGIKSLLLVRTETPK